MKCFLTKSQKEKRETIEPGLAAGERLLNAIGYYRRTQRRRPKRVDARGEVPETSHVLLCPLAGTAHYMSAALTTYMVADSRDVHPNLEGLRIEWYICTTYRRSNATENDKHL